MRRGERVQGSVLPRVPVRHFPCERFREWREASLGHKSFLHGPCRVGGERLGPCSRARETCRQFVKLSARSLLHTCTSEGQRLSKCRATLYLSLYYPTIGFDRTQRLRAVALAQHGEGAHLQTSHEGWGARARVLRRDFSLHPPQARRSSKIRNRPSPRCVGPVHARARRADRVAR